MRILQGKTTWITFFLVLAAIGSAGAGEPVPLASAHGDCNDCHGGNTGARRLGSAGCLGCHSGALEGESRGVFPASFPGPGSRAGIPSGHLSPAGFNGPQVPPGGRDRIAALKCSTCHDPHDPVNPAGLRTVGGTIALPADSRARLDRISRFCVSCHQDMLQFRDRNRKHFIRHPVGLRPVVIPPPGAGPFPLPLADVAGTRSTRDDVVACTTCHYVHSGPNPYLLRWDRAYEPTMCAFCHKEGRPMESMSPTQVAWVR